MRHLGAALGQTLLQGPGFTSAKAELEQQLLQVLCHHVGSSGGKESGGKAGG